MKIDSCAFLPKACGEGIITREIEGELLVYDRTRDRAHCLNETAAAVWSLCDGRRSVCEIALTLQKAKRTGPETEGRAAGKAMGPLVGERVVWLALNQLYRSHLLEEPKDNANVKTFRPRAMSANMSRREAVRRIGLGVAVAMPVVISMTAPTAAEAAVSCGATCHPCNSPVDCCGVCLPNVPGCPGTGNKCT